METEKKWDLKRFMKISLWLSVLVAFIMWIAGVVMHTKGVDTHTTAFTLDFYLHSLSVSFPWGSRINLLLVSITLPFFGVLAFGINELDKFCLKKGIMHTKGTMAFYVLAIVCLSTMLTSIPILLALQIILVFSVVLVGFSLILILAVVALGASTGEVVELRDSMLKTSVLATLLILIFTLILTIAKGSPFWVLTLVSMLSLSLILLFMGVCYMALQAIGSILKNQTKLNKQKK